MIESAYERPAEDGEASDTGYHIRSSLLFLVFRRLRQYLQETSLAAT